MRPNQSSCNQLRLNQSYDYFLITKCKLQTSLFQNRGTHDPIMIGCIKGMINLKSIGPTSSLKRHQPQHTVKRITRTIWRMPALYHQHQSSNHPNMFFLRKRLKVLVFKSPKRIMVVKSIQIFGMWSDFSSGRGTHSCES